MLIYGIAMLDCGPDLEPGPPVGELILRVDAASSSGINSLGSYPMRDGTTSGAPSRSSSWYSARNLVHSWTYLKRATVFLKAILGMPELPATATMVGFARLHGVSRAAAYKWKRRGLIAYTAAGKVDIAKSNRRLSERPALFRGGHARGLANGPKSDPDPGSNSEMWTTAEAVRRERIAAARLREIELAREAGEVVEIEEVADAVRAEYSIVRTSLLGMASKLAPRLAVTTSPEACGALVDTEVRAIELTQDASK